MVSLPMVCTAGADLDKCPAAVICYRAGANAPIMEIVADDDPNRCTVEWGEDENVHIFSVRLSHLATDPQMLCNGMRRHVMDPLLSMGYPELPHDELSEVVTSC